MSVGWNPTCSFNTNFHPDCVEFSKDGQFCLCGAYEFDESSGTREGCLYLFASSNDGFIQLAQEKAPGILDVSWMNDEYLVTAQSDSCLGLWLVNTNGLSCSASHKTEGIMLSVDVSDRRIASSNTTGKVYFGDINDPSFDSLESIQAHEAEVWCVAWDRSKREIFFTGADDGYFRIWDNRATLNSVASVKHEGGVCSVQNHPTIPYYISTGSYDDCLRIWDRRMLSNQSSASKPLSSHNVGGGVWRHKWISDEWVLAAAMYAGFVLCGPFDGSANLHCPNPINRYRTSAKLAYGIDGIKSHSDVTECSWTIATCSFYDNIVDFSNLKLSCTA